MTKKPLFWIAIALASALSFFVSWQFFAKAFPLLNVDISMSREAALETASTRVAALKLAPPDARPAVRFNSDGDARNFIELEGGGKEAFLALLHDDVYQALQWEVRFFREKDAVVTTLFFTPQGKPYGFTRHYPEKDSGAALSADDARRIAETAALRDWGVDLGAGKSPYALAEQSFQKQPSGRIDHSFIYERSDQRLGKNGEGRIRLSLMVAGDQLAELQHFVKIPQSFERRFAEMRSANMTIATTSSLAMGLLYGLGGCLIGLLLLKRQHFVVARPAVKWAALIALLQGAMLLNQIPSAWFSYDTAISANTFISQHVLMAVAAFLGMWLMLSISFMAAESLSRKAFGHQPQLWKLWTTGAANSWDILGRTMGGYLWVGFDLAFIVVFYYVTQHYLGWWSPLESLVDPNILATPMPWPTPVASALQAGFWEECLFRAVPLAGAALLGDYMNRRFNGRFGARTTWLVIGLVVQALIFGAAHAFYAQQPSYARPVELFLPSIMWGLVYLRFGLLPGIIFHFVFDLLLMSLPIFAISAPGLGLDRVMVILCGALPILIVLWARLRAGAWQGLPAQFFNAAWEAPAPPSPIEEMQTAAPQAQIWLRVRALLLPLGALGFAAWVAFTPFKQDALPLYLDRAQAENAADAALKERGVNLSEWQRFSQVMQDKEDGDAFVWREGGAANYAKLMGSYLAPPRWKVRYVRFDGDVADVAERAEEWAVVVENGTDGKGGQTAMPHIRLIDHEIPEARAGKTLSVEQAREIARRTVREQFRLDPASLREISAMETVRPNRKDWRFTFADDAAWPLKTGEARLEVYVAGDEASYAGRNVHVPEEWQRDERERHSLVSNIGIGLRVLLGLFSIGIIIAALIRSAHGGLDKGRFLSVAAVAFALGLLIQANSWQGLAMTLGTDQPLLSQLWIKGATLFIGVVIGALITGMYAGLAARGGMERKLGSARGTALLLPGIGLAAVLAGLAAAMATSSLPEMPRWESFSTLNQSYPLIGALLDGAGAALGKLAATTFVLLLLRDFSAGFSKRRVLTLLLLLPVGLSAAMQSSELPAFLILGLGNAAILVLTYILVARFEPKVVLIALLPSIFAQVIHAIIAPHPHAALYAGLYVAAECAVAVWWMRMLEGKKEAVPNTAEALAVVV